MFSLYVFTFGFLRMDRQGKGGSCFPIRAGKVRNDKERERLTPRTTTWREDDSRLCSTSRATNDVLPEAELDAQHQLVTTIHRKGSGGRGRDRVNKDTHG